MTAILKVAIIGAGPDVCSLIDAMRGTQLMEPVAIYDPDRLSAPWVKGVLAPSLYDDLGALWKIPQIDLYWVDVPTSARYSITRRLLEDGRATVITGPACLTEAEWFNLMQLQHDRFAYVALPERFGREISWWKEQSGSFGLRSLEGFEAVYLAPFVRRSLVTPEAMYGGDAWFHAGIRMLSVISEFLNPDALWIDSARMTSIPLLGEDRVVQASASAYFDRSDSSTTGHGFFDVNWTIDHQRHFTRLRHEGSVDNEVLLDHTHHAIYLRHRHEWSVLHAPEKSDADRHRLCWYSLVADVSASFRQGRGNLEQMSPIHRIAVARGDRGLSFRPSPGIPAVPDTRVWAAD